MVTGFEILLDCNNEVPELKKEDTTWVPSDWVDHTDPDAMATLLRDPICNIEEEEYWEACQHTLKSLYELRASDGNEEGGTALSDDEDRSEDKSDSSSDNSSSDGGYDDDDSSTNSDDNSSRSYDSPYSGDDWGELPSDREDEDVDLFYEEYDSDVDYYDEDIKDDVEANRWSDTDSNQYRLINVIEDARKKNAQANQMYHDEYSYWHLSNWSDITNVNSRSGPMYDKHGREVSKLGSYYDSEPNTQTLHTEKEDDIEARLAALNQKLMVHSLRIMMLENAKHNKEKIEDNKSEHLPQSTNLGNKDKHNLFDEWMDSIEHLDAFMTDKPTDIEVKEEITNDVDVDPTILMLWGEGAY